MAYGTGIGSPNLGAPNKQIPDDWLSGIAGWNQSTSASGGAGNPTWTGGTVNAYGSSAAGSASSSGVPSPGDIYANAQKYLRGYGNAQQAALHQSYKAALGGGMQQLASSGLAGTSIAPSMRLGYMRQYQQSLNELGSSLSAQRAQMESTVGFQAIQAQQAQRQFGLQSGYFGLAQKQSGLAEKQYGEDVRRYDLNRSDALRFAQGYGGYGGYGGGSRSGFSFPYGFGKTWGQNRSGLFAGANRLFS